MFKFWLRLKNAFHPEINRSDLLTLLRGLSQNELPKTRIDSLKGIMFWMRLPVKQLHEAKFPGHLESRNTRFKFFLQFLERNPEEAKFFVHTLQEFMERGLAIRLFCLTGVSESNNFLSELSDRIFMKIIPYAYGENDLAEIFKEIFTHEEDAEWFEECHSEILPPILALIERQNIRTQSLVSDLKDAMIVVTSRIASIGTTREIRRRLETKNLASSPFIRLGQTVFKEEESHQPILQEIAYCRLNLEMLRRSLESTGVSVELIYQMEKLNSLLDRLEMLIYLRQIDNEETKVLIISHFMGTLIRDEIRRSGIRDFVTDHLQLITKKIVERAGEKGDHYIANTKVEKSALLKAGAWAGVLTSFTALFKTLITLIHLPFLVEGVFFFVNYAIGFLLMQRWHLALSSKLPAFTASALAKKFDQFLQTKELFEITSEVKKISKSQFLAAFGNLIWVMPMCVLLDWSWFLMSGQHIFSSGEALYTLQKHGLLTSGTLFYSFITGIFLWLSSVIAGATENWLVFRNFPQIMKESPGLRLLLGKERAESTAHHFPAVAGAAAGNLSIAAFLAFPVVIGHVTGLPLDIRHITLAAGTITFALNSLEWDFTYWPLILSMFCSIFVMGLLNFGVSFFCALRMAALAKRVDGKYLRIIFKYAFYKRPKSKLSLRETL